MLPRPGPWVGLLVSVMLCAGGIAPANADIEAGLRACNRSDFVRARSELFQSATQGQAEAQFYLGEIYEGGVGVAIDYTGALRTGYQAYKWLTIAAFYGDPDARTERDRLLDGLSEAEKQRVQSLASDWEQRWESRNRTESP